MCQKCGFKVKIGHTFGFSVNIGQNLGFKFQKLLKCVKIFQFQVKIGPKTGFSVIILIWRSNLSLSVVFSGQNKPNVFFFNLVQSQTNSEFWFFKVKILSKNLFSVQIRSTFVKMLFIRSKLIEISQNFGF